MNKKETPLLSVCLITYNHVNYIRQAIESVLMQRINFTWELIIADDFSTDGTRKILLEYKEKYPEFIKLILQYKNVGPSKNWSDLLRRPKSKYIAYLEGDDFWVDSFKLKKQVNFLETNKEYCLVYSNYYILHEKGKAKVLKKANNKLQPTGYIFENLLVDNSIASLTICARRRVLNSSTEFDLFDSKGFLFGDLDLWLNMSNYGKMYYMKEAMATYRILEESLSHSKSPKKLIKNIRLTYNQRTYFINKYGCSEDTKKEVDYNYNCQILKMAFLLRDRKIGELAWRNILKLKFRTTIKQKIFYYSIVSEFIWYFTKLIRRFIHMLRNQSSQLRF